MNRDDQANSIQSERAPDSIGVSDLGGLDAAAGGRATDDSSESGGGCTTSESGSDVLEDAAISQAMAQSGPDKIARDLGVQQLRYEFRCKICKLIEQHPQLYKQIHEMVLRDRLSYTAALHKVNFIIEQEKLDITPLNIVNVGSHFRKHIGTDQRIALVISQSQPNMIPPSASTNTTKAVQRLIKENIGNEVDDFRNLDDIRSRLTTQMEGLENQLNCIDPITKEKKFDRWALGLYKDLIGEIRNCINDLNRMRQSERLIKTIVQQLLDRMTFAIIPQLLEEYTIISEELGHHGLPLTVVRNIDERLRTKTAQIIAQTARAAVVEVQRTFKLR